MAKREKSSIVSICNKYNLTPLQRKGIETTLDSKPFPTKEDLAEAIGVARKTLWLWENQEGYLSALHEAVEPLMKAEWAAIIKSGIGQAKAGDIQWAKWIAKLAGYDKEEVTVNHSGSIDIGDWGRKEAEDFIRVIRDIKAGRARTASIN